MNRSTPGLPVHHHLPEFTQTHVHQVNHKYKVPPNHEYQALKSKNKEQTIAEKLLDFVVVKLQD